MDTFFIANIYKYTIWEPGYSIRILNMLFILLNVLHSTIILVVISYGYCGFEILFDWFDIKFQECFLNMTTY